MKRFASLTLVALAAALVLGPNASTAFALDADDDGCPGAWGCKAAPEPSTDLAGARLHLGAARAYLDLALGEIPGHLGPEYQDPAAAARQATEALLPLQAALAFLPPPSALDPSASLIAPGTDDRLDPACYVNSPGGEDTMAADGSGQFILAGNVVKCSAWMVGHDFVATFDGCVPSGTPRGASVGLFAIGRSSLVCNGTSYAPVELYPVKLVARNPGRLAVMNAGPALLVNTILSQAHTPAPLWFGSDHTFAKESTMVSVQDRPRPGDSGADTLTVSPICWHNGRGFGSPLRASHNCDSAPNPGALEKGVGALIFANEVITCPVGQVCTPVPGGRAYGYNIGPTGGVSPGGPGSQNTMHFLNDDGDFLAPFVD